MPTSRSLGMCAAACLLALTPAQAQTWPLSPAPTLTIGQVEGAAEYLLNQVVHVRRLTDGRILVTMGPDIRYYNARGRFIGKAGGRGRGPGEFQYIQDLLVLPGDTLLALNFRDKVWLTADGKFVRQERMTLQPLSENGWFSEGANLLPNGNLLAQQYPQEKPGDPRLTELHRPTLRYTILDLTSGKVQPLIVSGGLRQMRTGERPAVQPFTPYAQHAIGTDRVYVGDNDTTFVSVFTLDGKPVGTIKIADKPTPVTGNDLDRHRQQMLALIGDNAQQKTEFERGWAAVPKPKRFPYWGSALVDRSGHLWISDPAPAQPAPTGWSVFDGNARRVARAILPSGFVPKEIGTDYVLGVTRDEFNVEYVRMYTLDRRAG